MSIQVEKALEALKSYPSSEEFIAGFKLKDLIDACAAWSMCGVEIKDVNVIIDDPFMLWQFCTFEINKWYNLLKFIPQTGFFYRLINSGIIYPDGTYDTEWINGKIEMLNRKAAK